MLHLTNNKNVKLIHLQMQYFPAIEYFPVWNVMVWMSLTPCGSIMWCHQCWVSRHALYFLACRSSPFLFREEALMSVLWFSSYSLTMMLKEEGGKGAGCVAVGCSSLFLPIELQLTGPGGARKRRRWHPWYLTALLPLALWEGDCHSWSSFGLPYNPE